MTPIIGDLIQSTVGKVVGGLVDKFLPASLSEEKKEEFKLKAGQLVVDEMKASVELEKIFSEDRGSARAREVEINKTEGSSWINKNIVPALAIGVISLSFILFYQVFWVGVSPDKKEVLVYILGVLSSMDMAILTYYFGSSSGSARKSEVIEKMMR